MTFEQPYLVRVSLGVNGNRRPVSLIFSSCRPAAAAPRNMRERDVEKETKQNTLSLPRVDDALLSSNPPPNARSKSRTHDYITIGPMFSVLPLREIELVRTTSIQLCNRPQCGLRPRIPSTLWSRFVFPSGKIRTKEKKNLATIANIHLNAFDHISCCHFLVDKRERRG